MHPVNGQQWNTVNEKWMRLHWWMTASLALAAALLEVIMAFALNRIEGVVNSDPTRYAIKYLLIPVAFNSILVLIGLLAVNSRRKGQIRQVLVSLCMAGVCLVLYGVHSLFPALILLPVVAILLTVSYGDYRLTSITAAVCLLGVPVVDLVVVWDSTQRHRLENVENRINWLLGLVMLLGCYLLSLVSIYYERERIRQAARQEWELRRDGLTGLLNRMALDDRLGQLCAGGQGVVVMMDLDGFKQLNDTLGHLQGDACLQMVAGILRSYAGEDAAFRYGGDEFCMVFHAPESSRIVQTCERIRKALEGICLFSPCRVGASFGMAECRPGMNPEQLLKNADSALYQAKEERGCIRRWEQTAR